MPDLQCDPTLNEKDYWNWVARKSCAENMGTFYDNFRKKRKIVKYLLEFLDLEGKMVLEIGVGNGLIGHCMKVLTDNLKYLGLDLSESFCRQAKKWWRIRTVNADATAIPFKKGTFDFVFAFDSFEHIADKPLLFREIGRVLKEHGGVMINNPLIESMHDPRVEHGFNISSLFGLCKEIGGRIVKQETYDVLVDEDRRFYEIILVGR